jgi:hypothetical protein
VKGESGCFANTTVVLGEFWFCLSCEFIEVPSNQEERISNVEEESGSARLEIDILGIGNFRSCCHVVRDGTADIIS